MNFDLHLFRALDGKWAVRIQGLTDDTLMVRPHKRSGYKTIEEALARAGAAIQLILGVK